MLSSWTVETLIRPTRISKHNIYGINIVILFFFTHSLTKIEYISHSSSISTVSTGENKRTFFGYPMKPCGFPI